MSVDQYMAQLANLLRTGTRSNAFAPYAWLCTVVVFACLVGMFAFDDHIIRYTLLFLLAISVIFGMVMYFILFSKDPRLLQSESYRIEDKKLDIIATKGGDVLLNPVDLTVPPKSLEENE